MVDYYKERMVESEEKLRLAKIGYQSELKDMGESLMHAKTYEDTDLVLANIKKSREAIKLLENEVESNKGYYEKEVNKPENKREEAKKILFGGNK